MSNLMCEICGVNFIHPGNLTLHKRKCQRLKANQAEILDLYLNKFVGIRQLRQRFRLQDEDIYKVLGDKARSVSESISLVHKQRPEIYKHTAATKAKLREIRLKWMKENPEKTAWRLKNLSYPEKLFLDKITELGWMTKYNIKREKSIFPYFIDFAFEDKMIAVEIDGGQHFLQERKKSDMKKDELLKSLGWKVVRVSEKEIKTNLSEFVMELEKLLYC